MARLTYAISLFTIFVAAAACGSISSSTPDAPVIQTTDAPPPIDGMPDALVCTAPDMQCVTGTCTNTNTDEQNCGTCGNVCKGGAYCKAQPDGCTCPGDFLPDPTNSSGVLAIFQQISQVHFNIGIGGFAGTNGLDALIVVVSTASTGGTEVDKDYTLTDPTQGFPPPVPIVSAGYGVDPSSQSADASYVATAGTVRFSTLSCDANGSELKGTITDATFQGVKGNLLGGQAQIDPNGCTFTVAKLDFDIKTTTACTP
ncbi:MAG TPA: hypothetical protein VL463_28555 [Kofleriaceae bacterium]|nr:hypothetical protein [Kofleriaceae bacterium]